MHADNPDTRPPIASKYLHSVGNTPFPTSFCTEYTVLTIGFDGSQRGSELANTPRQLSPETAQRPLAKLPVIA